MVRYPRSRNIVNFHYIYFYEVIKAHDIFPRLLGKVPPIKKSPISVFIQSSQWMVATKTFTFLVFNIKTVNGAVIRKIRVSENRKLFIIQRYLTN